MNKRILIVSANRHQKPYAVYPLGISYLYSYLYRHLSGYEIDLFDFNLESLEEYTQKIKQQKYNYICISLRNIDDVNIFAQNSFVAWYKTLIEITRECTVSPIIIGGAAYSIFPVELFKELKPDYAIHSEGEQALVELIDKLDTSLSIKEIEGVVYREDDEIKVNARENFVTAINLDIDAQLAQFYWKESGMLNLQTKRGCPYHCIYCSYPVIEGRKVRTLDVDIVIENIKAMKQKGIDYIFFTDSVFNINNAYNRELASRIIEEELNIRWMAYFAPYNLSYEDLVLYKQSGLTHIEFGTESFSDAQLKNYGKPFSFKDVEQVSNYCYDLGIFYAHFLIFGGYGETQATLQESLENSKLIKHSVFFPYVGMRVYPNTQLSKIALGEGLISCEKDLMNPVYYISKHVDLDTIKPMALSTGGKWVFPDDESSPMMQTLRKRGRKGPLWEYLRY